MLFLLLYQVMKLLGKRKINLLQVIIRLFLYPLLRPFLFYNIFITTVSLFSYRLNIVTCHVHMETNKKNPEIYISVILRLQS